MALVLKELRNLKQQVLSLRTENMEAKTTIDRLEAKVETMQVDVDRKLDVIIKLTKTAQQSKLNTGANPLSLEADGPKFPLKTMEMVAEMEERYDSDEVFQFKLVRTGQLGQQMHFQIHIAIQSFLPSLLTRIQYSKWEFYRRKSPSGAGLTISSSMRIRLTAELDGLRSANPESSPFLRVGPSVLQILIN